MQSKEIIVRMKFCAVPVASEISVHCLLCSNQKA